MSWERVKFGEILHSIIGGGTPSKSNSNFWNGDIYWCSVKDMRDDVHYLSSTIDTISESGLNNSSSNLIKPGTVITATRMGLGRVFINKVPMAINQDLKALIPNERVDNLFLLWLILSNKEQIISIGRGATVDGITIEMLREMEVVLPPLEKQKKIADILSTYDELIENNQKQIKLLEEAAQRLYKEWFVDLRFPGYEDTEIIDGLPKGWKKRKLTDIANVQYGYAFDGSMFNSQGKGTPIIRIRNIPNGTTDDYTTQEADSRYIVSNGDIVVGMDGEFHINSWSGKPAYLVQRTCKIEPKKELMRGWLLQAINEPIRFFEKTIVGSTVTHLGKKHIDSIELLTGTNNLYIPFKELFDRRQILLNQNILLAEASGRLLPKLMSGELEV